MSNVTAGSAQQVSRDLEEQLSAARREKGLVQVPALRRLRYVVLGLLVLSFLGLVFSAFQGFFVRKTGNLVDALNVGPSGQIAFVLYAVIVWLLTPLGWLQIYSYVRFITQFKRDHLEDLRDTMIVIPRLMVYAMILSLVTLPVGMVMFQHIEAIIGFAEGLLGSLLFALLMFLVIRHYIKTAMADLEHLRASSGFEGQRGSYPRWRSVYVFLLLPALIVLAIGYLLAGDALLL